MKFVFAPDSFKGSLTALQVCHALERAAKRHFPGVETVLAPVADGGEGTVEALVIATGGSYAKETVTGPMGQPVEASYGILPDGSCVMEMAGCSGLPLVPVNERDPLKASSVGTGQLLGHILSKGARQVLIGIGGSATNDGGMGMLHALGARFYDESKRELTPCGAAMEKVRSVDLGGLLPALRDAQLRVICDVTNPLLGDQGATRIYGPQKGASGEMLERLEAGMRNYAQVLEQAGYPIADFAGAGAAGGMGGALKGVLGAQLMRGIDAVLQAIHFDTLIQGADLVVTGEGRIDRQSVEYGKVPAGVAVRCKKQQVPVIALVGGIGEGAQAFHELGDCAMMSIVDAPMPLAHSMQDAARLMDDAADRMFRMLKIGSKFGH